MVCSQLEGTLREMCASVSVMAQHQLREIYDGQRRVSSFLVLERSEGEQHGQWEGRQHGLGGGRRGGGERWVRGREGGREEWREFDNAIPNKP